ncbi:MAG: hypothetical protein ACTSRW_13625 [Candidatus Helarchaeota archaeon]
MIRSTDPHAIYGFKGGLGRKVKFQGYIPSWDLEIIIDTRCRGKIIEPENLVTKITLDGPMDRINEFIDKLLRTLDLKPWENINWDKISMKFGISKIEAEKSWEPFFKKQER